MPNKNLISNIPHSLKEMNAQMDCATKKLRLALDAQKNNDVITYSRLTREVQDETRNVLEKSSENKKAFEKINYK